MRKYFIYLFAAVALMTACTETGPMEKPANRKDSGKSLFIGTIEQPGAPLTKTHTTLDSDATRESITWDEGDEIYVYGRATGTYESFYADQTGDEANFWNGDAEVPAWLTANDEDGYIAYYPAYARKIENEYLYDETGCPINYQQNGTILSCKTEDGINQVALENMPLVAESGKTGHTYRQRPLRFECRYAILKVTIPESLPYCSEMEVSYGDGIKLAEVSDIDLLPDGPKVVYVPIYDGPDYKFPKLKITVDSEAVMQIYGGEDLSETAANPEFAPNAIYAFDFCNTLTIPGYDSDEFDEGEEVETYELKANTLDYKINISEDYDGDDDAVVINAAGVNAPKNITINARGHKVTNLKIDAPYSHVEILNGNAVTVTAKTSLNSFVVKPTFKITTATVEGGSIVVEGTKENKKNVDNIVIPDDASEVRIYVNELAESTVQTDRVQITNNSAKENVVVVGVNGNNTTDKGEYDVYQEGHPVTEIEDFVAKIGDVKYITLAEAFDAAKDGETVTLIAANELPAQVELAGKAITLDLNGQTVSYVGSKALSSGVLLVHNGASLTIADAAGNGKIYSGGENQAYAAVALTKKGDDAASPAVLTVNGGELEGWYYAVVGNGQRHNTEIVINGGTVKGTDAGSAGIYNPQEGTITINGGTIVGDGAGIYMKAGSAAVANGGTVKATGAKGTYKPAQNGFEATGDAIIVDNCGYPGGAPSLTINGAELVSEKAYQVGAYYDGENATEISDILSSDNTLSVPAGYEWQEDAKSGMYKLVKAAATAKIGDKEYATLADALADVPTDGTETTITMVNDFETTEKVQIAATKNVVLDLNGKKISYATDSFGSFIDNRGQLKVADSAGNGIITAYFSKPDWNNGCYTINNFGVSSQQASKLVIEAGTIENTSPAGLAWPINNGSWGTNADLEINGGTIHSTNYVPVREYLQYGGVKRMVINGGKFISDNSRAIAVQFNDASVADKGSYVIINDGDFSCNGSGILYADLHAANLKTEGFTMTVNGGKFTNKNSDAPVLVYDKEGNDQSSAELLSGILKGGVYSVEPDADYVAAGFAVIENPDPATSKDYPYTVAEAPGVKVENQEELNAAVKDAKAGDVIKIVTAGTYKVPKISSNITIKGGDGVKFDCVGTGNIAEIPNGATFENVEFNFGSTGNYHGFQHAGTINMNGCTLNGLFFSYGDMNFNGCTFNQDTGEYMMWDYGKDLTYTDCVFNGHGKFINVYNEGNGNWKLTVTGCTFNSDKANKSALNIKASSGATNLGWDVIIKDCKVNDEKMFPDASGDATSSLFVGSPIWQVDDRTASSLEANIVKVTVDDVVVYGGK